MKLLIRFFCIITVTLWAQSTMSATLADSPALVKLSDQFIQLMAQDKTAQAYDSLHGYAIATDSEFDSIKSEALNKATQIKAQLGQSTGSALIKKERIEGHFEKHTYLIKYAKAALVWEITYYQADTGWKVMGVAFNTSLSDLYRTVD